ncbi:Cytochrome P450 [Penicillium occitanis (nom. inval.)]|nr:Cytochrome P450 [Penicillium occitanis (nom. inval.)]
MSACRALEADIVSEFSFGEAIGAIDAWHDRKELDMVSANDEIATWMPLLTNFPGLFRALSSLRCVLKTTTGCQIPDSRHIQDFRNWAEKACRSALLEKTPYNHNLIQILTRSGLPPNTSLAEAKENLGPGTDTTSATLAHIIWALGHNLQFQERLFQDLQNKNFSSDLSDLEAIPRLRACVKEGIRWTGAAAVMLPRLVPQGGIELHGKFIPEGVILSSSPIWYLRDAIAFPNPKDFDPYRWLTPDGLEISQNQLRDKFYIPFSKGGNTCIGAQ